MPLFIQRLRDLQDHYSTSGRLGFDNRHIFREAADEIERLRAEVADLTGANVLLHGLVSNREEEISGLRAQLAAFKTAAIDFIAKVDRGEARSKRSYAAFKAALSLSDEQQQPNPELKTADRKQGDQT